MFADDAITADEPDQRLGRLTGHIDVSAVPNHGIFITITGALTFDATVTNDQALAYLNAIHEAWNTGETYKGVRYAVRTSLELNGRVSMFNPRGVFHLTDCAMQSEMVGSGDCERLLSVPKRTWRAPWKPHSPGFDIFTHGGAVRV